MKFTVRDALEMEPLNQSKVVGGLEGLDREVRFVNIMEVPDVKRWMKGGEFLVTAGFAFHEVPTLIDTILDDLNTVGIAAFGIKLGPYLQSIPEALIAHANRLSIPLLELPKDVPYMDFMIPIFERLMLSQYRALKRVEQTHERLINLALHGEGIEGICLTLENILEAPILVLDKAANCMSVLCGNPYEHESLDLWDEGFVRFFEDQVVKQNLIVHRCNQVPYLNGTSLVIVPIEINRSIDRYLVAWDKEGNMDEVNLRALEHAATVIALEVIKEKAVYESEQQMRGELLEDLLYKLYKNRDLVLKRASFCNVNIHDELSVFVLDIDEFDDYIVKKKLQSEEDIQKIKQNLMQIVRFSMVNFLGYSPLLLARSDSIVGLIHHGEEQKKDDIRSLFLLLRKDILKKYPKLNVTVGIGSWKKNIDDLDESYEEAKLALKVSRSMNHQQGVAFFEDQGPYCFLSEYKDSAQLHSFYETTIGKLIHYDTNNKTELKDTLEAYFGCGQNVRLTAESMYLHRNSIIYRLKKIEEITGMSLSLPENSFSLQLALKIGDIIAE